MRIATGVRTNHRNQDLLNCSIQAAKQAGLGESLHVFADREMIGVENMDSSLSITLRSEPLDERTDFILSLAELFQREPHADFYVLLSNVMLLCKEFDSYLQQLPQDFQIGALFTPREIERQVEPFGAGFRQAPSKPTIGHGGDAWVFRAQALRELLRSDLAVATNRSFMDVSGPKPDRDDSPFVAESILAPFCKNTGRQLLYHFPSLAQISPESAVQPGTKRSEFFPGENATALQFLPSLSVSADRSTEECVVLVPVRDVIERECEAGLKELERKGYAVWRIFDSGSIDQVRNQLATQALAEGFTETMWIDPAIDFRAEDVERLRSHKLPLSCGLYPEIGKRSLASCLLPGTNEVHFGRNAELREILYAAGGFLHVRRETYDAIQAHLQLPTCNARFGKPIIPFFQPMIVDHATRGAWYLPEDFAFSERARSSGLKVMADASIRLKHIGRYGFSWEDAGVAPKRYSNFTLKLH